MAEQQLLRCRASRRRTGTASLRTLVSQKRRVVGLPYESLSAVAASSRAERTKLKSVEERTLGRPLGVVVAREAALHATSAFHALADWPLSGAALLSAAGSLGETVDELVASRAVHGNIVLNESF